MSFEPRIVAFRCIWASHTRADSAGSLPEKYGKNVRVIPVTCSGRMDPTFVLECFWKGADGVLLCGCQMKDCHYLEGNIKTARRILLLRKMLAQFGIEEERLRLEWVSASEEERFALLIKDMTESIRKLGPLRELAEV